MSSSLPIIALAIAEHSMCQPGRPFPHGDSQEGSPTFEAFHKAKSAGDRFSPCAALVSSPKNIPHKNDS
jgi:hypothetical protein